MIYIGIDPGLKGAIVVLDSVRVYIDPWCTTLESFQFLQGVHGWGDDMCAIVEKVTRPTKLTRNAGEWIGMLTALGIPFKEISPKKWQKYFGIFAKERTQRKNQLKQMAQRLHPQIKWTHVTADAYLLAIYAKEEAWK